MAASGGEGVRNLVERLGTEDWERARDRLDDLLEDADPARKEYLLEEVVAGFEHEAPGVRKWCVALLDHHATEECVDPLLGMLTDPKAAVRRHAVHSVGCQACKDDPLDVDVVGCLVERIEADSSVRVRRVAAHMLGNQLPDDRAASFLADLLETADDEKLRRNARWALERHRTAPPE